MYSHKMSQAQQLAFILDDIMFLIHLYARLDWLSQTIPPV